MKSRWFGVERGVRQGFLFVSTSVKYLYNVNGGGIRMSSAWERTIGVELLCMWMALSWWQTRGMELQTMLEVVQACVIRWRIKFNS